MLKLNLLDKLERKFGKYAIPDLMRYIVGLNAIVFVLMKLGNSGAFIEKLTLVPSAIMQGEVWRIFTYIFIPPSFSLIWIIFVLWFYYMLGSTLEQEWGSFKFNVFYLLGMLGTAVAAFIFGGSGTATYLNLSLLFAFARLFPDYEILIYFILPLKIKYLAWFNWAFVAYTILFMPSLRMAAVVSILNYFIFFGKDIIQRRNSFIRKNTYMKQIPRDFTIHKCTICGRTEKDDKNLEFRYCSTCEGDYEYCMDHLKNHEHKKSSS